MHQDEYIDYFKYRVKWSQSKYKMYKEEKGLHFTNNFMHPMWGSSPQCEEDRGGRSILLREEAHQGRNTLLFSVCTVCIGDLPLKIQKVQRGRMSIKIQDESCGPNQFFFYILMSILHARESASTVSFSAPYVIFIWPCRWKEIINLVLPLAGTRPWQWVIPLGAFFLRLLQENADSLICYFLCCKFSFLKLMCKDWSALE